MSSANPEIPFAIDINLRPAIAIVRGKTSTQTNFLNYTPANAGIFLVHLAETVNSVSSGSVQCSIGFTDFNANARTITLTSRTTAAYFSEGVSVLDSSNTSITVTATAGATINFDAVAILVRLA